MEDRLQKILSAAGVCSRRRAETYIQQGRVTVNGRPGVLGERADPDRDQWPWTACRWAGGGTTRC